MISFLSIEFLECNGVLKIMFLFFFKMDIRDQTLTREGICSMVRSVFDPLGCLPRSF